MRRAISLVSLGLVLPLCIALSAQRGAGQQTNNGGRGPSGIGRPATANEIKEWDISIHPDGRELPAGSGNATQGALVFTQRCCSGCHGPTGKEGPGPNLIGGKPTIQTSYYPIIYWPYAPMVWDWINRAMPYDRPGRLTPNEAYALTAFLLFRNNLVQEEDVMDAKSLPKVQMPHRSGYQIPPEWTANTPRGFQNKVHP
jgi:hypothetical protein